MEEIKNKKLINNIFYKKTISSINRSNSPIFQNKKTNNYLLIKDINEKQNKRYFSLKESKSTKNINHNNTTIPRKIIDSNNDNEFYFTQKKLFNSKSRFNNNENSKKFSYIKKKIAYQSSNSTRKNSNDNISNIINKNNQIIKNFSIKNIINSSKNSLSNKNFMANKIYLNTNSNSSLNINKKFYYSRLSIPLNNILSKKEKSEKNKISEQVKNLKSKLTGNKIDKTKLKVISSDTNTSKNIYNNNLKNNKMKLENRIKNNIIYKKEKNKTNIGIMNNLSKYILTKKNNNRKRYSDKNSNNNKKNKTNTIIYKPKKKIFRYKNNNNDSNNKKYISDLVLDDYFNEPKILCENNSTNDKSVNDSNKKKTSINSNKIINKFKLQRNKHKKIENDYFNTYEFDIGNEQNNKINGVKTNNFDVKKPKEQNLKFTIMKEEKESEISCSQANKIIIGSIDGYKDIIETDIKNREKNKYSKCFSNLIKTSNHGRNNKIGLEIGEYISNGGKKKISNLSTLIKKENELSIFNENNFYDSFNITNNLDGISSTFTNNIMNENKLEKININNINNINSNSKDFNSISFLINTDRSIEDLSKIINQNIKKGNDYNILSNNGRNSMNYNNKLLYQQNKNNKKDEIEVGNNNCIIF